MSSVASLLARAPFPLVVVAPRHWHGDAFLGDVLGTGAGVSSATFVYVEGGRGAAVIGTPAGRDVGEDLVRFVARFEPEAMARGIRRRRGALPDADFATSEVLTHVLGQERRVPLMTHVTLPFQVARVALGEADALVCGWSVAVVELLPLLEPLDEVMARAFDGAADAAYPPPEWTEP